MGFGRCGRSFRAFLGGNQALRGYGEHIKAHDISLPCAFLFREFPYKVVRPFIFSSTMASMTATAVILTMSRTELSKSVKWMGLFRPI